MSQEGFRGLYGLFKPLVADNADFAGELDEVSEVLICEVCSFVDERTLLETLLEVGKYRRIVVVVAFFHFVLIVIQTIEVDAAAILLVLPS